MTTPTESAPGGEQSKPVTSADGLEPDVGSRARTGVRLGAWSGIAQQALSVGATLVLARLLTPTDFGVVAAAQSALGAGALLLGVGFGTAVVRSDTADSRFLSTLFYSGLLFGGLVSAGFVVLSGPLAAAVGVRSARPYLAALAPTLTVGVVGGVVRGLLVRQLKYRSMMIVEIVGASSYFVVEVILAWAGLGAWAVIVGLIVGQVVRTVGLLLAAQWWPRPSLSWTVLRGQLAWSSGYLGANGFGYLFKNMDYWTVGHYLGARALGQYYVSFVLPDVVRIRIVGATADVITGSVAHLRRASADVAHAYLRAVRLAAVVATPVMLGIAVVAEPLILTLFGNTWTPAVAPLRVIAVAVLIDAVSAPAAAALNAVAAPRILLGLAALRVVVMAACLAAVVLVGAGLVGVGVAGLAATAAASLPAFFLGGRYMGASARAALVAVLRPLPPAALCCTVAAVVLVLLDAAAPALRLACACLSGGSVYLLTMWGMGGTAREDLSAAVRLLLPLRREHERA